jgi:hypothetical protein
MAEGLVAPPICRTLIAAALLTSACAIQGEPSPLGFVAEYGWTGRGELVPADLHVHTRFSDGRYSIAEMAAKARQYGCGALVIADHADRGLKAATPQYQAEIEAARAQVPGLTILGGLEWNVPPREGDDHATLLVPPGPREWSTLAEFKDQFDDFELGDRPKPQIEAALKWLDGRGEGGLKPVVIYNHPSRKDPISLDNAADLETWRSVSDVVVGFEGAPGHQGRDPIGSYSYAERTVDRWDPAAARIGDAWDITLQRGMTMHGAIAGSDFHTDDPGDLNDRWPCQFAETWLTVPERSPAGILRALRAGSFFGVHGHIARDVELSAEIPGIPRAARAGEIVRIAEPAAVTVSLSLTVPEIDWEGRPNRIDSVEFIVVTSEGASSVLKPTQITGHRTITHEFIAGVQGLVVRARGRRVVEDGPDLMFYTNAIRIAVGN